MNGDRPARSLPDEKRIIGLARRGDKNAFRQLMEGYQDRLFGLVFSLVQNREQAEDLIQEIFVKAYFALSAFEGQSAFYTWLYRIASNHCLDHLRKRRPQQISIDRPMADDSEATFQDTLEAPASDSPEASLEASSEAASLLEALDPEQKLILSLRELEGYSYEDLAELLHCPLNTVKSRLNRARQALKQAYEKKYGPVRRDPDEGGPGRRSLGEDGNIREAKIVLESREIT